jgi:hypothetical protein
MSDAEPLVTAADIARQLAERLDARRQQYALGGAIALGYWGEPRGTIDVDLTLYLPPDKPSECLSLLQDIGCDFSAREAAQSLEEHGFCRASFSGVRVDVFLPIAPFYETARARRQRVELAKQPILVWDAESLAVFKMMFFRRKDLADVEQILRAQGPRFDRGWVRERLVEMYGTRDPRVAQWDELDQQTRDKPQAR